MQSAKSIGWEAAGPMALFLPYVNCKGKERECGFYRLKETSNKPVVKNKKIMRLLGKSLHLSGHLMMIRND